MRVVPPPVRRFLRDERAAVTVEFALWLPMIFVLLSGAILFFDLFRVSSKAVKATNMLGDIVTRQATVDDAFLATLRPLLEASMPNGQLELRVRITSVRRLPEEADDADDDLAGGKATAPRGSDDDDDGADDGRDDDDDDGRDAPRYEIQWSWRDGGGAPMTLADLPEEMMPEMAEGDSVIVTETVLRHSPIGGRILGIEPMTYRNVSISRPRFVPAVVKD